MADGAGLEGQRVLVVGGSSGIGRGVALGVVAAGAQLVVVGRRAENLAEVVTTAGGGTGVVADVRDGERCASLVDEAVDALGGLDVVVYAAGVSPLTALAQTDADVWHDVMATNTIAPALVTRAVLPSLSANGVVMFVSSVTTGYGYDGLGPYAASKAALDSTIRGWRTEHADVRFVRLAVGDTGGTEFARGFDLELAGAMFPRWIKNNVLWEKQMDADDLGLAITEIVTTLVTHPSLTIPDVTITPPGPMAGGGAESLVEELGAAAEAQ
jgi:NAD(P)-dependent dehydrogenase (short-subunit alcohol dehydrogenase family)